VRNSRFQSLEHGTSKLVLAGVGGPTSAICYQTLAVSQLVQVGVGGPTQQKCHLALAIDSVKYKGTGQKANYVNSRRNLTATGSRSLSTRQMRFTLVDVAERRSLVRVQVRVGVRVGDAPSAGIIVVCRRELSVALSRGRH
jgi:hypothetical protein